MVKLTNDIKKDNGFTIVELLVVIVVIGILAAITIVSYTGITARANVSSAQSAANAVISKATAFTADGTTGTWPVHMSDLTGAASSASYFLSSASVPLAAATLAAAPATPATVNFLLCGTSGTATAPTTYATITVPSGIQINYWNYAATPAAVANYTAGVASGTYLTFPVACFISTT
jgi:prepilin-type N-terminal cleavage/methylation domain-containing protein